MTEKQTNKQKVTDSNKKKKSFAEQNKTKQDL